MPATVTWPLVPDAEPASSSAQETAAQALAAERGQLAFLGFGLLRPFRRDEKSDFANGGGRRLLDARIGQILGTRADTNAAPGELPWRTDFGSRLHQLRHRNNTAGLAELAQLMVEEALDRWEKNIVLTAVDVVDKLTGDPVVDDAIEMLSGPQDRTLAIRVRYELVDQAGSRVVDGSATIPLA